jgi:hypothetical protein
MYQQVRKPKAVGPQVLAITFGLVIGIGAAVGCGDEEIEVGGAAAKAGTPPPAQVTGTVDTKLPRDAADNLRAKAGTGSLAGTTGDNVTDTRAGAGFKLTYEKGHGID